MSFTHTFDSLSKVLSNDSPVELTISNNSITIDPNIGNYFFLDGIDTNLTVNLSNLTEGYTKTIYLRLNFDEDDIVLSWPTNIKWHEIAPPSISQYEDLFISLMTLDGGITWYSEPVIKTKPLTDLSYYMANKYPGSFRALTSIPISDILYFSKIRPTSLDNTFSGYFGSGGDSTSYLELDLSILDTSNVTNMSRTFFICSSLTSLDLSNWNTSNVTTMYGMFNSCSSLASLDLSNWNTSNVTTMEGMFYDCSALKYLIIESPTFKFQMKHSYCGNINSKCKILVPSTLIGTYQNATNWSLIASQFDAIENYNITRSNGQVTVTPNS